MLLNWALLTWMRGFPFTAEARISPPICSPSRSQSVQMKSALQYLACSSMFFATSFLSCAESQRAILIDRRGSGTYICDRGYYRSIEKADWWWMEPVFVFMAKLCAGEMAKDGCHGHLASTPWWAKVELETVVLDILVPSVTL